MGAALPDNDHPPEGPTAEGRRPYRFLFGVGSLVLLLDQLSKAWIVHSFPVFYRKVVIPGLFNLVYVRNSGGAFSLLAGRGESWKQGLFVVVGFAALAVIFFIYRQLAETDRRSHWGLALIFGGALGNLLDRMRFGQVIDFLDFHLGSHHWPVFNVADSAITIGVIVLLTVVLTTRTE